jgi:anti-sigma regulatory factor (Ser/Thr protein kinase)
MISLQYPKLQTIAYSNTLLNLCHQARTTEEDLITFDLLKTEFICPFGIILLTGSISECLVRKKDAKYKRPNKEATRKFLSGIGFNKFFKLPDEDYKIESPNVQLKRVKHLDTLLTDQIIDVFKTRIRMSEGVEGSLRMALNELMMNAFDHSESERGCYVCAQSYIRAKKIRLCIADFGIGIQQSLKKVPEYVNLDDDHEAIALAVKEGVTSRVDRTAGYGLSHINRFIKVNEGKMYILSGNGKVLWDNMSSIKPKKKNQIVRVPFQGTVINLEVNADGEGFYFLKSEEGEIF